MAQNTDPLFGSKSMNMDALLEMQKRLGKDLYIELLLLYMRHLNVEGLTVRDVRSIAFDFLIERMPSLAEREVLEIVTTVGDTGNFAEQIAKILIPDENENDRVVEAAGLFGREPRAIHSGAYTGVYVSSDSIDDAERLFARTNDLLSHLGFRLVHADDWQRGSWWRTALFCIRRNVPKLQLLDRTRIIEDVLFGRHSLEVATGIAKSTVELIEALKDQKGTVAIDAGLFLFLKRAREDGEADIFAKRLTVEERAALDADPTRISRPDELFEKIEGLRTVNLDQLAKEGGTPKYTEDKRPEKRLPPPGPEDQDLAG